MLGRYASVGFKVAGQGALIGKVVFVGDLFQTGFRGAHGEFETQHQVFVDNLFGRKACLALYNDNYLLKNQCSWLIIFVTKLLCLYICITNCKTTANEEKNIIVINDCKLVINDG